MVERDSDRSQVKLDQILTAAQKRFGHYGLSKTAMIDIANDIGMSKASLYYYFKDKESIFLAVVEKDKLHFLHEMKKITQSSWHSERKLTEYVNLRIALLKTLITLGKFSYGSFLEFKPQINCFLQDFKKEEQKMIAEILESGVANEEFVIADIQKHADFFIDTLLSMRKAILSESTDGDIIEFTPKKYQRLKDQSSLFVNIFINGVAVNSHKHI